LFHRKQLENMMESGWWQYLHTGVQRRRFAFDIGGDITLLLLYNETLHIWLTDKLHDLISVLFLILWIFQLIVWFVHSDEQHEFKVKDCPRWLRMLFQIRLHQSVTRLHFTQKIQIYHIIFVPNYCWCSWLYPRLKDCVSFRTAFVFLSVIRTYPHMYSMIARSFLTYLL